MNFGQLESYIRDLRQSGFDTMRLRVALWHKLAYPLVAIVMAVLAIPFALSMGRRGSLTGIAVAIARGSRLLGGRRPVRRHGQRELSSRTARRLVVRCSVRPHRRIPAAANAHLISACSTCNVPHVRGPPSVPRSGPGIACSCADRQAEIRRQSPCPDAHPSPAPANSTAGRAPRIAARFPQIASRLSRARVST